MTRIHLHTLQRSAAPQPRQAPAHQADEPAPPGASSAPLKDGFDRSAPPQEALGAAPMNESSRLQLERQLRTSAERVASGGADAARALAARAAAVAVAEVRPEPRPVWRGRRRYETRRLSCEHEDDIAATASGSSSSFTLIPHRGALSNSMDAYSARSARSSAGCGRENAA